MLRQLVYCELEHQWRTSDMSKLDDVTVYRLETSDESAPLPQGGVTLYPPENNEVDDDEQLECTLSMTCKNPPYNMQITAVDIISSAKALEVYSDKREYIETSPGMRLHIEALGENRVFLSQHTFEPPKTSCLLKFVSRYKREELYVHSVQISIEPVTPSPPSVLPHGSINLPQVRDMLGQSETQLSDEAKALFNTLEAYQKNKTSGANAALGGLFGGVPPAVGSGSPGAPNLAVLAGMFASMGMGRHASRNKDLDAIDDENTSNHNSTENNCQSPPALDGEQSQPPFPTNEHARDLTLVLPQLTAILDTKLQEMEQRICDRLSRQIAHTEQKLLRVILNRTGTTSDVDEAELDLD